jgi:peptidoglycan/LPS O-acetylase OafA/YrhL
VRFFDRVDLSYGMYLYGYPVEQGIRATVGSGATPMITLALAVPNTAGLAFMSWRFVERAWLSPKRVELAVGELDLERPQVLPQVVD